MSQKDKNDKDQENETIENKKIQDKFSWYGCVIANEKGVPVLFPFNRMGYAMDGAEISDEEEFYKDVLNENTISIVKCYFLKENNKNESELVTPEQAAEDYMYQGLSFEIEDMEQVSIQSSIEDFESLWEVRSEDNGKFLNIMKMVMSDFMEREFDDKVYLGFSILTDKEQKPCLYTMSKMGVLYPPIYYQAGKEYAIEQSPEEAVVLEVKYTDGTRPISLDDANKRFPTEKENIFVSVKEIGKVELNVDTFSTWDEALSKKREEVEQTLKLAMYALSEQYNS